MPKLIKAFYWARNANWAECTKIRQTKYSFVCGNEWLLHVFSAVTVTEPLNKALGRNRRSIVLHVPDVRTARQRLKTSFFIKNRQKNSDKQKKIEDIIFQLFSRRLISSSKSSGLTEWEYLEENYMVSGTTVNETFRPHDLFCRPGTSRSSMEYQLTSRTLFLPSGTSTMDEHSVHSHRSVEKWLRALSDDCVPL